VVNWQKKERREFERRSDDITRWSNAREFGTELKSWLSRGRGFKWKCRSLAAQDGEEVEKRQKDQGVMRGVM